MAAMATSILRSGTSSRSWDGCLHHFPPIPAYASTLPKSILRFFSADSREPNFLWHRKLGLQLTRASPSKGHIREIDQSAEHSEQKERLVSAQGVDDQRPGIHEDDNDGPNVLRHADAKVDVSMDNVGSSEKDEMQTTENKEEEGTLRDTAFKGSIVAGLLLIGVVGGVGAASYIYREQISAFLLEFSDFIEGYGAAGYVLFVAAYAGLEVLAIPAIPLTMSAGLLFGTFTGTILVSIAGTIAATAAFLIARYLVRDRILKLAEGNKKFLAIDKAIGENGFRVVALLRLSPLLPFSLGNYLYGLTSVKLVPYVLGSWLGMLPGTWAYVSAGAVGRAIIQEAENPLNGGPEQLLTLGIGILITVIAATYVSRLAKDAIKDIE